MKKTLKLYQTGDFSEAFQLIRAWDAPFDEIAKLIPQRGVIVDLGCGDGLLANYIAINGPNTKVYGVDINKERVSDANKGIKNAKFVVGDILTQKVPSCDLILLIHVLHHLPSYKSQEKLLNDCLKKLKKNGKLIICEIAETPMHKYLFTYLTDTVIVPILFEGKLFNSKVFFRKTKDWQKLFTKLNLKYKSKLEHRAKPFSHIIFDCSKA